MQFDAALPLPSARRRAALAIAGTTCLALFALSHHPVATKTSSLQESLAQLVALQQSDAVVHGGLIVMLAILAACLRVFSALIGRRRASVLLATAAYGIGCGLVLGAMLLDGFVVPQLARQFIAAPHSEVEVVYVVLRVIGTVIQVLTKAGLLSMCVALLAWSCALAFTPALRWSRWCAALGGTAGLLPAFFIMLADMRLTPTSLMAIFGLHCVWNLGVAAILIRCRDQGGGTYLQSVRSRA